MSRSCEWCGDPLPPGSHHNRRQHSPPCDAGHTAAVAVARAAGLDPLERFPGASARWRCRCVECGAAVSPRLDNVRKGTGCRLCAHRRRGERQRAEAAEAAVATMRRAGLEPLEDYPGSGTPWRSRCQRCGAEVAPRYVNVQQRGGGCQTCWEARRGEATSLGRWGAAGLVTPERAAEAFRAAGLVPLGPYPGSTLTPWPSSCDGCGAEVAPSYASVRDGARCAECGHGRSARTRLARQAPAAVARLARHGLVPAEPYPGSEVPWRCRCTRCGTECSRVLEGLGRPGRVDCPSCDAYAGWRPDAPARVYLVTHPRLGAHKVGVCSVTSPVRMAQHRAAGWHVYRATPPMPRAEAARVESQVLRHLRDVLGLGPYLAAGVLPYSGHTETVDADAIGLPTLWQLVTDTAESA